VHPIIFGYSLGIAMPHPNKNLPTPNAGCHGLRIERDLSIIYTLLILFRKSNNMHGRAHGYYFDLLKPIHHDHASHNITNIPVFDKGP
jgi:hypothetical protein